MNGRKVFGIGLSRTGTSSLTLALEELGFRALHFPCDDATQREMYAFFSSRPEKLWLSTLEQYDALTDTPVCCVYKALDRAYPHSRFILTVRQKSAWMESCRRWWEQRSRRRLAGIPDVPFRSYITAINQLVYGTDEFNEEIFSTVYDSYLRDALQYFAGRPRDLLVLDVCGGAGWVELCRFLEIERHTLPEFPCKKYPDFRQSTSPE